MSRKLNLWTFFSLGAFSLAAQTILIREYLISFQGNEIAIAIFYAAWFFWIALGAQIVILKNSISKYFPLILSFYPFLALLEFFLFRSLRGIAGVGAWELFPFQKILPLSILFNAPFSLATGIIFTAGCRLLKNPPDKNAAVVSKAYISESIGSFFAGVGIIILILKIVNPALILTVLSLLFLTISLFDSLYLKSKAAVFISCIGLVLDRKSVV